VSVALKEKNIFKDRKATSMRIRGYLFGALVLAATGAGFVSAASAQQSCQDLWVERNSYYKEAGYCFKTARAISYFGNDGCTFYNEARVPLPRGIRARIAEITWLERRNGCN
jgi:hypothetical protein